MGNELINKSMSSIRDRGVATVKPQRATPGAAESKAYDAMGVLFRLRMALCRFKGQDTQEMALYVAAIAIKQINRAAARAGGASCKKYFFMDGVRSVFKELRSHKHFDDAVRTPDGLTYSSVIYDAMCHIIQYAKESDPLLRALVVPCDGEVAVAAHGVLGHRNGSTAGSSHDGDVARWRDAADSIARVPLHQYDPTRHQALNVQVVLDHLVRDGCMVAKKRETAEFQAMPGAPLRDEPLWCLTWAGGTLFAGDYGGYSLPAGKGAVVGLVFVEVVATIVQHRLRCRYQRDKAALPDSWPVAELVVAMAEVMLEQLLLQKITLRDVNGVDMDAAATMSHVQAIVAAHFVSITVAELDGSFRLVALMERFCTAAKPTWLRDVVLDLTDVERELKAYQHGAVWEWLDRFHTGGTKALRELEAAGFLPRAMLERRVPRSATGFASKSLSELMSDPKFIDIDVLGAPPEAQFTTMRWLECYDQQGRVGVVQQGHVDISGYCPLALGTIQHDRAPVAVCFNRRNMSVVVGILRKADSNFMDVVFCMSLTEMLKAGGELCSAAVYALGAPRATRRAAAAYAEEEAERNASAAAAGGSGAEECGDDSEEGASKQPAASGSGSGSGSGAGGTAPATLLPLRRKRDEEEPATAPTPSSEEAARVLMLTPDSAAIDWPPVDLDACLESAGEMGYPAADAAGGLAAYLRVAGAPPGAPPLLQVGQRVPRLPVGATAAVVAAAQAAIAAENASDLQAAEARGNAVSDSILSRLNRQRVPKGSLEKKKKK